MEIKKTYHFYGAHRNKNADEKCGRIHGHTYYIDCIFSTGEINEKTGVTILFGEFDKQVEPIIKEYCHFLLLYDQDPLCDVLDLAGEPYKKLPFETSVENLCVWFATRIKNETGLPLKRIEIRETKSSLVSYEVKS